MNGFIYTLTLEEPVLANKFGGEPNSAESLFYIPGGSIRGAAIQAFGRRNDAAVDKDFRRLFLSGETRFLNAYPVQDSIRTLPAPLTWQTERKPKPANKTKKVFRDLCCVPVDPDTKEKIDTKSVPFSFWALTKEKDGNEKTKDVLHTPVETNQINVHTQRDAVRGRATSDAGAVYRYIALPAEMQLQGIVLTANEADAKNLQGLLNGKSILLGKARTAGYGHAKVKTHALPGNWRESGQELKATNTFTLTLLSPAIVRDENGQTSLEIAPALTARLGTLTIDDCQRQSEIVGGFNRQWGLPLPQVTAISAGSVFTITANVTADKLLELEETGIGERRAEGFGRVVINLHLPDEVKWDRTETELDPRATGQIPANDPLAKMMLLRVLRRDLEQQTLHAARNATEKYLSNENKTVVPASQLSRWRVIVRDILGAETKEIDLKRLNDFVEKSKNKAGWKKMEKARIDFNGQRPRLTEWIEMLLENPETLKQSWDEKFSPNHNIGQTSVSVDAQLNTEYRLRLLDAVLAMMAKKSGGKNG
jgi:CRISPR-associated protein Csx10